MRTKTKTETLQLNVHKVTLGTKLLRNRTLILMCMPAIIFFIVFNYIPMPGAYIAFTDFNYNKGIFGSRFVGFKNFEFLFNSGKLWQLTRNTVLYNLAFIFLGNALQVIIALMLNSILSKTFRKVSQTLLFLPYFISAVLVGFMVYALFNYDYGFINGVLKNLGQDPISFYSKAGVWPVIIIVANLWQSTGYGSIVYFAALCGIDQSLIEAARIDGANGAQVIRYILLPSLKSTAIILILFSLGGIMKGNFGLFYNIVGTANANLQPMTDIIELYVYRTLINQFNFPYSTAAGLYQSIFGFIIVNIANAVVRKIDPEYALF